MCRSGLIPVGSQRDLFDVPDDLVYMNTANMSPLLRAVREAGERAVARRAAPWRLGAADWFTDRRLTVELRWASSAPGGLTHAFPALDLQGLDFLFVLSFTVGLYSMHRLLAVREEGDVKPEVVVSEFYAEVRRTVRSVSTIGGLRRLTAFPYAVLLTLAPERRRPRRRKGGEREDAGGFTRRVSDQRHSRPDALEGSSEPA